MKEKVLKDSSLKLHSVTVRLTPKEFEALKKVSIKKYRGTNMSQTLRWMIEDMLKGEE